MPSKRSPSEDNNMGLDTENVTVLFLEPPLACPGLSASLKLPAPSSSPGPDRAEAFSSLPVISSPPSCATDSGLALLWRLLRGPPRPAALLLIDCLFEMDCRFETEDRLETDDRDCRRLRLSGEPPSLISEPVLADRDIRRLRGESCPSSPTSPPSAAPACAPATPTRALFQPNLSATTQYVADRTTMPITVRRPYK